MKVLNYRYQVAERLNLIFGEWQSCARNRSERTQKDFSKLLNIERKALMNWLRGDTLPKAEQIYQICKLCNCSADWLLGLSNQRKGYFKVK